MKHKLLPFILLMICLIGCAEIESERIIDYRYNESRTDLVTDYEYKYNWHIGEYQLVPNTHSRYVPESFELLWEYTYDDGHTERTWKTCTRLEYEEAKKTLK